MGARLHNLFSLTEIKRKMERMSTTAIQTENAFETTTTAVIIYDTFAFAAKAKAMLDRAAHRAGDIMRWSVKPWRVDMLKVPPAADAALAEAAEAHLIMLAVRQVQSFFPWLADWLERWARCRRVREAGLALDGVDAAKIIHPGITPLRFVEGTVALFALALLAIGGLWIRSRESSILARPEGAPPYPVRVPSPQARSGRPQTQAGGDGNEEPERQFWKH